jgi:cell division septal protein FtsQ
MWPKRKAKNRKNNREAVLQVKMRSREARRHRLRAITAAVGLVCGTAAGALVLWQAYQWALLQFVFRNEAYAIRRIELQHEGRLRSEQIRLWADVQEGENLLALDLDQVRHDLELYPWIERADAQARRPDCLRLTVQEREPVARIIVWRFSREERRAWAETNYLDRNGVVLPPLRPEWVAPGESIDFSHLPRLVGLERVPLNPGQRLRLPQVEAALRLLESYSNSDLRAVVDLEEIDVQKPEGLEGVIRGGTRLTFGMGDFDRQMRRWRSIHDYAESQGRELEWLDLSVTNNLPARGRSTTNAPAGGAPPRPRRFHHV